MDIAAALQECLEDTVLFSLEKLRARTGMRNLCMAGGVALNCVANGVVLREGPFEEMWIQPCAGDGGNALGAALLLRGHASTTPPI